MLQVAFARPGLSDGDGREGAIAILVAEGDFGVSLAFTFAVAAITTAAPSALARVGFGRVVAESGSGNDCCRGAEHAAEHFSPRAISAQAFHDAIKCSPIHSYPFLLFTSGVSPAEAFLLSILE